MKFHHVGIACNNIGDEIANISKIHRQLFTKVQ